MNKTDEPKKQAVPFASRGQREELLANTPSGDNSASYDLGFPPITMILKAAGGLPPKGQDMNQILYELAAVARWSGAGGSYSFDSAFSNTVAGYPAGARILASDGSGFWLNTLDANTTPPENASASLTGWIPDGNFGLTFVKVLAKTSLVLTTLQAAKETLILTGNLTANMTVIVPAWVKKWTVFNNCSGEFTVTVKTATGTGVAVTAGSSINLFGEGTDIFGNQIAAHNSSSGSLLNIKTLLKSTQYTPSAGTKKIRVRIQGGGGPGGSTKPTKAGEVACGSGGTAGAYGETTLIDATAIKELPCKVGEGGIYYSKGANSTFGSYITAPGGRVGYEGGGGSGSITPSGTGPSDPCTGSAVLFSCRGQGGNGPIVVGSMDTQVRGGNGGASFFGGGGGRS